MTSSTPVYSPASLAVLTGRIAVGDRPALQQLYDTLRGPVQHEARRTLSAIGDVRAVLHATFVEVRWLARFHTTADEDVSAWVLGIAERRAAERRYVPGDSALRDHDDETSRLTFERLLGEPLRSPRPDPPRVRAVRLVATDSRVRERVRDAAVDRHPVCDA